MSSHMQKSRLQLNAVNNDRSVLLFAHHLSQMNIQRVLDIGSNSGQFAEKLRHLGYRGTIFSVEPQARAYDDLLEASRGDLGWIPLPRQGVGAKNDWFHLNISMNSWSSSLMPVHENHIDAEPTVRTVGTEEVFVRRAAELLQPEVMQRIEALKIDVQGYEAEVLKGYLDWLPNIRLLILEMSLVECYVGAPSLFELDKFLVEDHGFSRVSLEPAYYDETKGIVQQYDGIYFRPESLANDATQQSLPSPALVTSSRGHISRPRRDGSDVGEAWQQFCHECWKDIPAEIVSVSECPPPFASIKWVSTVTRPSIAEIFRVIQDLGSNTTILVNSDVALLPSFKDVYPQLTADVIYYGRRLEVETEADRPTELVTRGIYQLGFDYFILPLAFVRFIANNNLFPAEFRAGEPWWGYLIPLIGISYGFPVKRLPETIPLAAHYLHESSYDQVCWMRDSQSILTLIQSLYDDPKCCARSLLKELLQPTTDEKSRFERISHIICNSLP